MEFFRVACAAKGYELGDRVESRTTFLGRGLGLMFRDRLFPGEGLWLRNVDSIHMCFMRFPIDAVFVDGDGVVVRTAGNVRPWIGFAMAKARDVIELPAGVIAETGCEAGDCLSFTAMPGV